MDSNYPMLVSYKGALAGSRWTLETDFVVIGRAPDATIVLPERQISRYHARIERDADGYLLHDLGSKNGTFINGEAVHGQPYRLCDGDEITLATAIVLGFVAGDATLPLNELNESSGNVPQLEIDSASRRVRFGRKELTPGLSPAQFALLTLLMRTADNIVTRQDVIQTVWPDARGGITDQAVDALVYRLRERLMELNPDHDYVVTVRGHGFRFFV